MGRGSRNEIRKRISFKPGPDDTVKYRSNSKRELKRNRDRSASRFPYACAVIMKDREATADSPARQSPRNNPVFAGQTPNGNGRHAKRRRWLAAKHR